MPANGTLRITGTAVVGNVLTATLTDPDGLYQGRDGLFDGNTLGEAQYSFYVQSGDVHGSGYGIKSWSTSSSLKLTSDLAGKKIFAVAMYQDMSHTIEYPCSNTVQVAAV